MYQVPSTKLNGPTSRATLDDTVCFPDFHAASVSWCLKQAQRRGQPQEHMVHLSPTETEET